MARVTDFNAPRIRCDASITEIDGRRAIAVLPIAPEDAPYAVREGITRRRVAVLEGRCPCGALATLSDAPGAPVVASVTHGERCPASDERLVKAVRRWLG